MKYIAAYQTLEVVAALFFFFFQAKYIFCKYKKLPVDPSRDLGSLKLHVHQTEISNNVIRFSNQLL